MTPVPIAPLYLSRLILNPRSRQVLGEMAHPYEMHRTLMRAFPKAGDDAQAKAREEFGVLFRADTDEPRSAVKVFVQSSVEPTWTFLDGLDDYLRADTEMSEYEYKDILPAYREIQDGQVLSFRLRANPTKRIAKDDDTMKGKRVELIREDEQIAWLIRKGRGAERGVPGAFELLMRKGTDAEGKELLIPRVNVCCEGKQTGRKKNEAHGHATTHLAVLFEGLLRVTDKNAFLEILLRGIGAGKSFGFGLLSIAPAPTPG